jgi:hypothetical protein
MSIAILFFMNVVVTAVGLGLCHRELRIIRRGLGALDEGAGRRAAAVVSGLQSLKEPLESIRTGVEELSPQRRPTVEQRGPFSKRVGAVPVAAAVESKGLRLDLPRAAEDERDSDGETRLVRQPTLAELRAAGAVAPGVRLPAPVKRAVTPPERGTTLKPVCRMCEGGGMMRARSGALEPCGGCNGAGYVDPEGAVLDAEERAARVPG